MSLEFPWYDVVEGEDLEQGDFLDNCLVIVPDYITSSSEDETTFLSKSAYQIKSVGDYYDIVIVSQSCDLANGKIEYVLICPRWSIKEYAEANPEFAKLDKLEQIRQGKNHRYCMLNNCSLKDFQREIQIVDLGVVFSIPYDVMKQMAKSTGKRLRLRSPYKEKLAQAFAFYYMRVALPEDIPTLKKPKIQQT